jgi:lycopene cyclase domain-containing protein
LINFFTIIICFIASFDRRIRFNQYFVSYLKAAAITIIPFILWDFWFTQTQVWWFNPEYTLGIKLLGLPLEEYLFFFCIPFSCVFTYFCFEKFFNLAWTNKLSKYIIWLILSIFILSAIVHHEKKYPFVLSVVGVVTMIYLFYIARVDWLGKATMIYIILLPGFFLVNGILTGSGLESPIVNYNPEEILNIRMWTIPVEDTFYGFIQFVVIIYFFKKISSTHATISKQ